MSSSIATIFAGLFGILLGHLVTRSWQMKQWKMENRKTEYRELLTALTLSYNGIIFWKQVEPGEEKMRLYRQQSAFSNCLHDRLFTATELQEHGIAMKWTKAVSPYQNEVNKVTATHLYTTYEELRKQLVSLALQSFTVFDEDKSS